MWCVLWQLRRRLLAYLDAEGFSVAEAESDAEAWEMYHLEKDPLEEEDLAGKNRGKFNELAAAMRVQIQAGGAVPWQAASPQD